MTNKEKVYFNAIYIKEKTFDNGGVILNTKIKVNEFIEELKRHEDGGWVNINIGRRLNISDNGWTHYVTLNDFKPDPGYSKSNNFQNSDNSNNLDDVNPDSPF
tara:strand:+ start:2944 stop:3252 length:309 start_codon:yes stop_codon:yes gene_type:complete